MNTHAYAHGFATKLAEYNISPAEFVQAAQQVGSPELLKIARILVASQQEKRAYNLNPLQMGALGAVGGPLAGIASAYNSGGDLGSGLGVAGGSIIGSDIGRAIGGGLAGGGTEEQQQFAAGLGGMLGSGLGTGMAEKYYQDRRGPQGILNQIKDKFGL
jgi:hypothetical protein